MADIKVAMSVVTTWPTTLDEDIANYAAAGADGIGVWEYKLSSGTEKDYAREIADAGLRTAICGPRVPSILPDFFFSEPRNPRDRVRELCRAIARFSEFDPVAVLCVTGDPRELGQDEGRRIVIEGMRQAGRVAADHGVTLGLEPQRAGQNPLVTSIRDAVDLVEEIGSASIGVLADIYHFWDLPEAGADLRAYADRLVGIQLSDYRNPTRGPLDRVLPGDGVIDTRATFRVLDNAGYDGWYEVEVFSDNGLWGDDYPDSLWSEDPRALATRAVRQVRDLWATRNDADALGKGIRPKP